MVDVAIVGTNTTLTTPTDSKLIAMFPSKEHTNIGTLKAYYVTAATVDAAWATMNTDSDVSGNTWVLDEDNMASNSATKLATQQSIKAYVDSLGGDMAAATYDPTTVAGDAFLMSNFAEAADAKILTSAERTILSNTSGTNTWDQSLTAYQLKPSEWAFADWDKTKLDWIETAADVTDATNVWAALTLTGDVTSSGSMATTIAAWAVDVAMLANGTDWELITWDAAGAPAVVAVGTANQVLTSNGTGAAPTFQAAAWGTPEGTAVLSTWEAGGTKYLREDWDGTCSWQTPSGSWDFLADGSVPMTGNLDLGWNNIVASIGTGIEDENGNEQITFITTASAVNQMAYTNAATGNAPTLLATGADTNVDGDLVTKGSGVWKTNWVDIATANTALMDSEVTNLAQVKAFDTTDYAAALGVDDNYVTDAEKTVIGNTSWTNTWDQDLSWYAQDSDIGTTIQAYDAGLQSIAGLTTLADRMIYTTASDTYTVTPLTAAGRALIDDASATAQRTTLGVGTADSPQFTAVNIGHATDTTVTRVSAGKIAVEGVTIPTLSSTSTLTNKTLTSPTLTTPVLGTPTSGNLSNCTVDGTNDVGFRVIPQESKSAAYTLVLADSGKHIYHPWADTTARIWTIPANASVAYPVGTALTFINDTSAGVVTIAITTDTMILAGAGTTGSRTLAANGIATAVKITATRWMISGTGLS